MTVQINLEAFKKRIVTLLLRSGLTDLPKSAQDQQILCKSATLKMRKNEQMSEAEVNEKLSDWLQKVANLHTYDHVTLRRALVDYGYLNRSSDGATYMLSPSGPSGFEFETGIDDIDLEAVLEAAREEMEARKRAYMENKKA